MTAPIPVTAPEMCGRLIMAIVARPDETPTLRVDPAVRFRHGAPPEPMVIASLPGFEALMSAATARHAAVLISISPWALVAHPDPAALGLLFTAAADEADRLAAGDPPPEEKLH
jgi:hypothetical protein